MPSDIFYFLQSDWLQQRAAFYDILTVVQKCYFFKTNQGVELIVVLELKCTKAYSNDIKDRK